MNRRHIEDMAISAVIAAALFALMSAQTGVGWREILIGSLVIALKDIQAYRSPGPTKPQSPASDGSDESVGSGTPAA